MKLRDLEIGDVITPGLGLELAKYFKLDYIVERIENNLDKYEDFIFDGCSCLPDRLLGVFTEKNWTDITYYCCLPHDIAYAYGKFGDDEEKKIVDKKFQEDLVSMGGMDSWIADMFYTAVKLGGGEKFGFSFSWGFANKVKK